MTLAIHHALRTSERATQYVGSFQTAPSLRPERGFVDALPPSNWMGSSGIL